MARLVFNLTDDQRERWKVAAFGELVSLAEWIRRACEARLAEDEREDHVIEHAPEMVEARESAAAELVAGTVKPLSEVVEAIEAKSQRPAKPRTAKCTHPHHGRVGWRCPGCREMF